MRCLAKPVLCRSQQADESKDNNSSSVCKAGRRKLREGGRRLPLSLRKPVVGHRALPQVRHLRDTEKRMHVWATKSEVARGAELVRAASGRDPELLANDGAMSWGHRI